jgi:hypothetical protein
MATYLVYVRDKEDPARVRVVGRFVNSHAYRARRHAENEARKQRHKGLSTSVARFKPGRPERVTRRAIPGGAGGTATQG